MRYCERERGMNRPESPVRHVICAVLPPSFLLISLETNWTLLTQHYSQYHLLSAKGEGAPKVDQKTVEDYNSRNDGRTSLP